MNPLAHRALVNPIKRLLRGKRARFERVPPGCVGQLTETNDADRPLRFTVVGPDDGDTPLVEYDCDYAVLATGGELSPITDDRQTADGSIEVRRARLTKQVRAVMDDCRSALVVGGGLTGVELAAELAERLGPGTVTLAVGPTLPSRGRYPGDPGAGLLPGFRDTCDQKKNLGRGGAGRYATKFLERKGVRLLQSWAVPPPAGATLSNVTAAARPSCARSWRDAGSGETLEDDAWERAGPEADLSADAVFDCRGIRPNSREAYTKYVDGKAVLSGLPSEVWAPSGWLRVDDHFRLSRRLRRGENDGAEQVLPHGGQILPYDPSYCAPAYGGRCYCVGDAAEKDKQERTAANAHAEGEYAAHDILAAVRGRPPLPPYVAPPRLTAISLGKWDGVVVLGNWVALRGVLAAVAKMVIQFYFVHFLPLPYWLMRRLPFKRPRQYGGTLGAPRDVQLARSGARGAMRRRSKPVAA